MYRFLILTPLLAAPALAVSPPTGPIDQITGFSRFVDQDRMKATVNKLVSFGTRHTLSSQTDSRRGIGAALAWTDSEFKALGLETIRTCDTVVKLPRIPTPTRICNVVAIQRGSERPNDVVILTGHIDSRVSDPMNSTADAPGANDDGSGTAAVIEAARVLSQFRFPGTIVYGVLSGEEQGLNGGKILADYALSQRWNVVANLNNDIIGNSCGSDGVCDDKTVRVFSEGPRWQGHAELAEDIRRFGGENDSPSRNISRFLDTLAEQIPEIGLDVMQVWRNDRFGRGGDHTEFLNAGLPAVRLSVAIENYDQQHQDLRTEKGRVYGDTADKMDFAYLRKVTRLNTAAAAWLASAPPPPAPTVEGAVSPDATISWSIPFRSPDHYVAHWRRTDSSRWSERSDMPAICTQVASMQSCSLVLPHVRVDDWVFGVSAVGPDGFESPVASAVPGGAFKPYVKAADGKK